MHVTTNVVRASNNLEVAMVLDITGSMSGDIDSLKAAANSLVDLVVQDVQTPYYSKLAIVPYSNAVNVGTDYIDTVRGATTAPVTITGASKTNPVVITAAGHGFSNGDFVYIDGVNGMTQLNGNTYKVASASSNTFALQTTGGSNVNGTSYGKFKTGNDPKAYCRKYGCDYYRFTNASGNVRTWPASTTCVTERTGSNKYNDTAPSTAKVGFHYTSSLKRLPGGVDQAAQHRQDGAQGGGRPAR